MRIRTISSFYTCSYTKSPLDGITSNVSCLRFLFAKLRDSGTRPTLILPTALPEASILHNSFALAWIFRMRPPRALVYVLARLSPSPYDDSPQQLSLIPTPIPGQIWLRHPAPLSRAPQQRASDIPADLSSVCTPLHNRFSCPDFRQHLNTCRSGVREYPRFNKNPSAKLRGIAHAAQMGPHLFFRVAKSIEKKHL